MTRVEYELLSDNRPDLKLPVWPLLWEHEIEQVKAITPDQCIAWVVQQKLIGNDCWNSVFLGSGSRIFS